MTAATLTYVLVTPARNEEALIQGTIDAVVGQTRRPLRWVIVSDGSTDATDDIVLAQCEKHDWIELLRMPEHRDRQFAAKATCFNAGARQLEALEYDLIGNLDADITFEPDYYECLLARFAENPSLGVAGTPFVEEHGKPGRHTYAHEAANLQHVSGACQLFRRECFADVGGYRPIKGGAIDWVAVTTARMRGWQTRTFVDKVCYHHRKIGTATQSTLAARFHYGRKAYYVGGDPLWELGRGVFQMGRPPLVVGGISFIAGYLWALATRMERPVPAELIAFHREEQRVRLRRVVRRAFRFGGDADAGKAGR